MRWLLCIPLMALPFVSMAQDIESQSKAAAAQLAEAAIQLNRASKAQDRIKALTNTILAYENGLSAMRENLRRAALRQERLTKKLKAHDQETAALIGVLQSMGGGSSPTVFLHPQGPTGATRAGMLLSELTPVLNAKAQDLSAELKELKQLRNFQQEAANQLQEGLFSVQQARISLSKAMAERTDLPRSFTQDPVRTAILISSTKTLEDFAAGLSEIGQEEADVIYPELPMGEIPLPVQGVVLRKMNEEDAAGIAHPGIILATQPAALVHAPAAGTLRYVGPLLEYENVIIFEPQKDMLFIFAGLKVAYGQAGQVIDKGVPLGLMAGASLSDEPQNDATSLSIDTLKAGNISSETLYIEVRKDNVPQDPTKWFRMDKDG